MTGRDEPWFQKRPAICRACEHRWVAYTPCNVALSAWLAHVMALQCPECGADYKKLSFDLSAKAPA